MGRPSACGGCGECDRCRHAAYMREWYRRPGNAEAQRQSARASRERRIDAVREYDRQRGFRGDPEKNKARSLANRRLPVAQPCEVCGEKGERHHDDYGKPKEVRWLCRTHHAQLHRRIP